MSDPRSEQQLQWDDTIAELKRATRNFDPTLPRNATLRETLDAIRRYVARGSQHDA